MRVTTFLSRLASLLLGTVLGLATTWSWYGLHAQEYSERFKEIYLVVRPGTVRTLRELPGKRVCLGLGPKLRVGHLASAAGLSSKLKVPDECNASTLRELINLLLSVPP